MENQNNNKGVIALLVVIIVILAVLCVLFATGTISFAKGSTNNNEQTNQNEQTNTANNGTTNDSNVIQTKLVDNLVCNNSETTFNGITVKLEQKDNNGVCKVNSFTVNGKDIMNDVSLWVNSYEIYDNNVIIASGDTSGRLFTIYSLATNSAVMKLQPENLNGYWVTSYSTNNNIITINGKECGEQCGTGTTGYTKATYEIEYSNNSFSSPKLVSHSN